MPLSMAASSGAGIAGMATSARAAGSAAMAAAAAGAAATAVSASVERTVRSPLPDLAPLGRLAQPAFELGEREVEGRVPVVGRRLGPDGRAPWI